jgi:exosortase A
MSLPLTLAPAIRAQLLRTVLLPLLLCLLALVCLFWTEIDSAVTVWSTSTAYNHCFLVLPIAVWLAWERRARLADLTIRPLPWAALLAVPLALAWFAAERLGIMEGRQLAALGIVDVTVLTLLGWQVVRAFAAPLIYLVFLVPFGAFLTSSLQDITVHFVVTGLDLLGITNYSDGYTIEIPEGVFYVAEACAGLRFLIAAIAFGVLYAFMLYRSPMRRLVFVGISVVVPVIANGFRALGIVVAGHVIGSAEAAAADHLIYGWLFFSVVILLLILAGLPFRQDGSGVATMPPTGARMPALTSGSYLPATMAGLAVLMVALAGSGPLLAEQLDRSAAREVVSAPPALAGCEVARVAPLDPALQATLAAEGAAAATFFCQNATLRVLALAFPPRTNPMHFLALQRTLTQPVGAEDVAITALPSADDPGWQQVTTRDPNHVSATALWIDGAAASGGVRGRLRQALRSFHAPGAPIILAVVEAADPSALPALLHRANVENRMSQQMAAWSINKK